MTKVLGLLHIFVSLFARSILPNKFKVGRRWPVDYNRHSKVCRKPRGPQVFQEPQMDKLRQAAEFVQV